MAVEVPLVEVGVKVLANLCKIQVLSRFVIKIISKKVILLPNSAQPSSQMCSCVKVQIALQKPCMVLQSDSYFNHRVSMSIVCSVSLKQVFKSLS